MTDTDIAALVERLRYLAGGVGASAYGEAADALEALYADNFALAAWQCPFKDGKTGLVNDEHGNQYCAMQARAEKAEAENERIKDINQKQYDEGYANGLAFAKSERRAKGKRLAKFVMSAGDKP